MKELDKIKELFDLQVKDVKNIDDLNNLRTDFLGKNGHITNAMKLIKDMSVEDKKSFGVGVNVLKDEISKCLEDKKIELDNLKIQAVFECHSQRTRGNAHRLYI